ncbi:NUDIX hydrolase [Nocardia bovistercoris]|uniref:NUDIX domain-containing protein n=1 Tax=Nocardia bovistercoris TaxID=2785916 RepID=A0A931IAW8_9NOCA|nr:NUDIX domain-containing protein [Nocardia bovistercoris]MBH0777118.1 NUDIX domain-containing protein [Nocardia bovistercoris]
MTSQRATAQPTLTSVAWMCVENGRVLAVRTEGRDAFYLPGGKPEPGETLAAALVREVREEVGVDIDEEGITPEVTITAPAHGRPGTLVVMHCFRAAGRGTPGPAAEIAEMAWLGPRDAELCAPAVRRALEHLTAVGGWSWNPSLAA